MRKLSLLALSISLIFGSCTKKGVGDNQTLDPDKNTTVTEYMSTNPGSWWLFKLEENNTIKETARKPTGNKATIDGFEYDLYHSIDSSTMYVTNEYFAKNEDFYLTLIDLDGSQTNYVRAIVYKDNGKIGDTWTSTHQMTYSGMNIDIEITTSISGINDTRALNGKSYDSVFVTSSTMRAKSGLIPWTNCGNVEMWFRRGIGILKTDFNMSILNLYNRQTKVELLDYHIEK